MTCAVCGTEVAPILHHFHVGMASAPSETWTILAPLYFAVTPDFRRMKAPLCGPVCSTRYHRPHPLPVPLHAGQN